MTTVLFAVPKTGSPTQPGAPLASLMLPQRFGHPSLHPMGADPKFLDPTSPRVQPRAPSHILASISPVTSSPWSSGTSSWAL